jgi:hypothetical protein
MRRRLDKVFKQRPRLGVDERCRTGDHDYPKEKADYAYYEDDTTCYFTGTCRRCGYSHRWTVKRDGMA